MIGKNSFTKNVIASVVASVLFIALIQPFLTFFWNAIADNTNAWLVSFIDSNYKNAALGHRNYLDVTFLIMITGLGLGLVISVPVLEYLLSNPEAAKKVPGSRSPFFIGLAIVYLVCSSFLLIRSITDLQLNTSFSQRMAVINPHVTDLQSKQLLASWAMMNSRKDYVSINARLDSLARQANISLPEPLLN